MYTKCTPCAQFFVIAMWHCMGQRLVSILGLKLKEICWKSTRALSDFLLFCLMISILFFVFDD
jgi:hypothetical protein